MSDDKLKPLRDQIDAIDAQLLALLKQHRWNVSEVARSLGIARMTVYRRMKRLDITAPNHLDA